MYLVMCLTSSTFGCKNYKNVESLGIGRVAMQHVSVSVIIDEYFKYLVGSPVRYMVILV